MNVKLQKIMLDAGFTCPNRDGTVGTGGCSFCRTESFNPAYCRGEQGPLTITQQLEAGKRFFQGKYPDMKYLAYFQAYTNSYAPLEVLRARYEEALAVEDVVGLVIGTRPDCVPPEVVGYLSTIQERGFQVVVELGVESMYDKTLRRVNRGHSVACSQDAIRRCAAAGLQVGVHLMIGLPGESREEILAMAPMLNALPIHSLKLHQLQILRGTRMEEEWREHPEDFLSPTAQEYAALVSEFIVQLKPSIHLERFAAAAPPSLVVAPKWGLKPAEVEKLIVKP